MTKASRDISYKTYKFCHKTLQISYISSSQSLLLCELSLKTQLGKFPAKNIRPFPFCIDIIGAFWLQKRIATN